MGWGLVRRVCIKILQQFSRDYSSRVKAISTLKALVLKQFLQWPAHPGHPLEPLEGCMRLFSQRRWVSDVFWKGSGKCHACLRALWNLNAMRYYTF